MTPEQMKAIAIAQARRKRMQSETGETVDAEAPADDFETLMRAEAAKVSQATRDNSLVDDLKAIPGRAEEMVRTMGRGVLGVGSYLDEADAATNATLAPVVDPLLPDSYQKLPQETWGDRYDKALEIQRGKDKTFDEENPATSTGLKIGGGVLSGLGLLKAAPVAGQYVLGNMGRTTAGKVIASTAAGAGAGAVQGFGAGEGNAENRAKQSAEEMVIGGILGGAVVPISALASKGIKLGKEYFTRQKVADALSGINRDAAKYVEKELADPAKVAMQKAELDKLGPEAMLADVSPDWLGVARGASTRPGTRDDIVNALMDRSKAANTRLGEDVRQNLGDAVIPSQVNEGIEESQRAVGQLYAPLFENARAVDTTDLANSLDSAVVNLRGPAQEALRRVRGYLNIPGEQVLDPNPRALFESRQAIDGLITSETNPKVVQQLTQARQEIDGLLSEAVPQIKEVDAQFQELARQKEGLTQGRPVLNNEASALRPEEVDGMLTEGALPAGEMIGPSGVPTRIKQSTRAEIERAVGTKANDLGALKRIVQGEGDWNRAKLGMMFGDENAERALAAIDREAAFADTANRVARGSDTAMANRFGDFLDETAKPKTLPGDTTLTGLALKGGKSIADSLLRENADSAASRFAEQIGSLSVAKGDSRDAIVQALMNRGLRLQSVNDPKIQKLIAALLQTGGRSAYPSLPGVRE
ncbi:hypothetical protein IHQ71_04350 [Rhizobium sp. TH2]|uniref:hypothetical protein n=1 Tax=Rhizobium sp. TH2 TaxID=2775403 RepID=UPI002157732A|nr:hypothetical protein [Rhizobium sp. TH2]UVC09851.1 hypothetical protein IHQ71_04350 [Rhizobium sp. TH2]